MFGARKWRVSGRMHEFGQCLVLESDACPVACMNSDNVWCQKVKRVRSYACSQDLSGASTWFKDAIWLCSELETGACRTRVCEALVGEGSWRVSARLHVCRYVLFGAIHLYLCPRLSMLFWAVGWQSMARAAHVLVTHYLVRVRTSACQINRLRKFACNPILWNLIHVRV